MHKYVQEGFLGPIENEANGFFTVTLKRGVKQFERKYTRCSFVCKPKELPPVLNGMGVAVISTSKGVMTNRKARALRCWKYCVKFGSNVPLLGAASLLRR